MNKKLREFISRHDSFILTTHDPADADGLGAQMVLGCILKKEDKQFRIVNASPMPEHFKFMDPQGMVEEWDTEKHGALVKQSALFIVDTADENNIGEMKDVLTQVREVFVIDHHEPKAQGALPGICDPSAASASELTVALAEASGAAIDPRAAFAAYTGIAYDTGFFAYPKTGPRTMRAATALLVLGASPNDAYRNLYEHISNEALMLQKRAIESMTLHCSGRVASQVLRDHDFTETGALRGDTDGLVNFPLKSREIVVSILIKETEEKKCRCSLRSKGSINVAKIAEIFGGGGHVNAAGLRSNMDVNQTLNKVLEHIAAVLDKP